MNQVLFQKSLVYRCLFLIMLLSKSNLFLTEFMFKWAQINLLGFFSLRLLSSSLELVKLFFRERSLSRVSRTWLSLSEFRLTDVCKLIFCCWRELSFFKNTEKFLKNSTVGMMWNPFMSFKNVLYQKQNIKVLENL